MSHVTYPTSGTFEVVVPAQAVIPFTFLSYSMRLFGIQQSSMINHSGLQMGLSLSCGATATRKILYPAMHTHSDKALELGMEYMQTTSLVGKVILYNER
jgi:hypothetical protein